MNVVKSTVMEMVLVAVVGLCIGLSANALNPNGLSLSRNYFETGRLEALKDRIATQPADHDPHPTANSGADTTNNNTVSHPGEPDENAIIESLRDQWGLQGVTHAEVVEFYKDPAYRDGAYLFIDARSGDHYKDGHIPGAYHLDHFHPERTLDAILQACQLAMKVIVYCNGGECDDSIYSSEILVSHDVDPNQLMVYAGGMQAWKAARLPIEKGTRNSGSFTGGNQP